MDATVTVTLQNQKNSFKINYSVSCDLPAAPEPGQSAGPGSRLELTEKDHPIRALKKVMINILLYRLVLGWELCSGVGTAEILH